MNRLARALLAVGFLGTVQGWAAPPQGALVSPPRPGLAWTVEVAGELRETRADESTFLAERSDFIREENSVGHGIRKQVRHFKDGKSFVRYRVEDLILYFDTRSNRIEISPVGEDAPGGNLSLTSFSELRWITSGQFRGKTEVRGAACDIYAENDQTAMIAHGTRLPLQLESGGITWIYKFENRPVVELPPEYKKALEERKAAILWRKQRYNIPQ